VQIGVLRRAAVRLRFAYPIVQEYLAACWMKANAPKEIGARFASISRRPWAQALQFALEMHPDAGTIINHQLKVPDDAFNTILRLIARCIVNGAKVSVKVRRLVGDRLAEAWPSEAYSIRESLGYLLADGFLDPLPPKAVEHISAWALHCGGAEIVAAKSSPALTLKILRKYIAQDLTHRPHLHGWQIAVDDIAEEALDLYLERARESRTTEKELDSLSLLIASLPPSRLRLNRWQEIATDPTLPLIIRLAGYLLAPRPVPVSAWSVIDDVIRLSELDEMYLYDYPAYNLYWHMHDAEDKFVQMLNDTAVSEKRLRSTLEGLMRSDMESDDKRTILRRAMSRSNPSQNVRFLMLLCLAIWGANKFRETTVRNAANILSERLFDAKKLLQLIGSADFGLSYKTDAIDFSGAVGNEPYIHPARADMLSHLLANLKDDDESIDVLKVRLQTGDTRACERLITVMRRFVAGFQGFMPFDDDYEINATLYLLGQQSTSLPLDLLFQIIDKSSSNAGREAVNWIVRSGDEKITLQLLERYNSRGQDFVREAIFSGLETLAGRYGKRFIRDGAKLIIE
jgi:hypothetical protein